MIALITNVIDDLRRPVYNRIALAVATLGPSHGLCRGAERSRLLSLAWLFRTMGITPDDESQNAGILPYVVELQGLDVAALALAAAQTVSKVGSQVFMVYSP
jgi:hypothetical protein